MAEPVFSLTYEGGDADAGLMDMRLLGQSIQGADRITSDGLILLIHKCSPKRGERAPLLVKVREPVHGSYHLPALLQDAAWLLPLGYALAQEVTSEFISQWWQAVKSRFLGNRDATEAAIQAMVDLNRDHLAARDASEARAHEMQMAYLQTIREVLSLQQRPLEQFVAPIGRTATSARVRPGAAPAVLVDARDADQIRDLAELTWEPLGEIVLRTDGFRFHTSGLSIENPERDGFLMAKVIDPRFDKPENAYTEAAQRKSEIIVLARRGYKNGELVRIDIVDFVREITP
jgi:hypothetical protein